MPSEHPFAHEKRLTAAMLATEPPIFYDELEADERLYATLTSYWGMNRTWRTVLPQPLAFLRLPLLVLDWRLYRKR